DRSGLASAVFPADRFVDEVAAYAARLAVASAVALALTKRLLTQSPDTPLEAHLRDELAQIKTCLATPEVQRAMAAFRAPDVPNGAPRGAPNEVPNEVPNATRAP